MSRNSYVPVDAGDKDEATSRTPRPTSMPPNVGDVDLGRQSVFRENFSRPGSPQAHGQANVAMSSPQLLGEDRPFLSSASAYAPIDGPDRPPFLSSRSLTPSRTEEAMSRSGSALPWAPFGSNDHPSIRHSLMSFGSFRNDDNQSSVDTGIPMRPYSLNDDSRRNSEMPMLPSEKPSPSGDEKLNFIRADRRKPSRRQWMIFAGVIAALIVIAIVVAVPLVTLHDRENGGGSSNSGGGSGKNLPTSGGDKSVITMDNGTTFVYNNSFGGYWRSGLTDNGAKAQSYTPAMNETWDYANDRMLGVNLGGWLVIEPFIVPSFFEPYENNSATYVVDEYTLMQQWTKESGADGARQNMIKHYETFVTEQDFAEIAAAGLNWIRLPIGYWAIATEPGEPFLEGVAWTYFLKAVKWARKYGLRINLDLHAIPGSQNGYNHGGRLGVFNFLNSPMGMISAERTLDIIRIITEFISQPEISNVVPLFGILNEPNVPSGIGIDSVRRFYGEVYGVVRNITGTGSNHGPFISYHDGFMGLNSWTGFMQGSDRVSWDLHPYTCFVPPFGDRQNLITTACNNFMANTDQGLQQFGLTVAGEWSLATNDCGLYLNGPFQGVRYDGTWSSGEYEKQGDCAPFDNWWNYNATYKQDMMNSAIAQMQAFRNFFFWTWKIGGSERIGGRSPNPNWSYQLGLQQGWMPTDPHNQSVGACGMLQQGGISGIQKTSLDWKTAFADYQTGAASTYAPNSSTFFWPPTSLYSSGTSNAMAASTLPVYTSTGAPEIPPTPVPSVSSPHEPTPSINPWASGGAAYNVPAYAGIQGCAYPSAGIWSNYTSPISGWPCTGAQKRMLRLGYPAGGKADEELYAFGDDTWNAQLFAENAKEMPAMPAPTRAPQAFRR